MMAMDAGGQKMESSIRQTRCNVIDDSRNLIDGLASQRKAYGQVSHFVV